MHCQDCHGHASFKMSAQSITASKRYGILTKNNIYKSTDRCKTLGCTLPTSLLQLLCFGCDRHVSCELSAQEHELRKQTVHIVDLIDGKLCKDMASITVVVIRLSIIQHLGRTPPCCIGEWIMPLVTTFMLWAFCMFTTPQKCCPAT